MENFKYNTYWWVDDEEYSGPALLKETGYDVTNGIIKYCCVTIYHQDIGKIDMKTIRHNHAFFIRSFIRESCEEEFFQYAKEATLKRLDYINKKLNYQEISKHQNTWARRYA